MDTTFQPIDQHMLIALLAAGRSRQVHACANKDGWNLVVRNSKTEWALADKYDAVRVFPTLRVLQDFLHEIAVPNFLVDISMLNTHADDPATRERLREAQEAGEYDAWLRRQVREALDDPDPSIPNRVVKKRSAARRAELLARLSQKET